MSTFSGLNTANSALNAQRIALEVAGQNVANANTAGYTRQRATLEAISGPMTTMASTGPKPGLGVGVAGIERLGDIFLDARVRATGSSSSYLLARADTYTRIEKVMNEPSDNGLSAAFNDLWSSFQEVAKSPQTLATKQVVLERAQAVSTALRAGYTDLETQWSQHRSELAGHIGEVNNAAQAVAELNGQIQLTTAAGGNTAELEDRRVTALQTLSELTGASARYREDGTVDVTVGGNLLVSGKSAQKMVLSGATSLTEVMSTPAQELTVTWDRPGSPKVVFDGGTVSGLLTATDTPARGGLIAKVAEGYNNVATQTATQVNAILAGADNPADLFTVTGEPAAKFLQISITDPNALSVAAPGKGAFDGSIADAVAQLGVATDSPSAQWKALAVGVGSAAKSAVSSAEVAYSAFETASNLQLSNASVDVDEETVNMLAYQRGYQAASRVMTTIDEMLDQLINRTGVVGR